MPLVTVVMPAYNVDAYISRSIESVITQSETAWELIIVNDGSTDQTENVVRAYMEQDARIQLIVQKNQGVSVARNNGLSIAKGKYITFLDADDWYDPHYLEKMVTPLETNMADITICKYKEVDLDGNIRSESPKNIQCLIENSLITHILNVKNTHANMAMMYRTSLLKTYNVSFLEGCGNGEDRLFVLEASFYGRATLVPEYLYFYLYRVDSACRASISYEQYFKKLEGYLALRDFFLQQINLAEQEKLSDSDISAYLLYIDQEIASIHNDLRRQMWRDLKDRHFDRVSQVLVAYQRKFKQPFKTQERGFKRITNFVKVKIIQSNLQGLWEIIF